MLSFANYNLNNRSEQWHYAMNWLDKKSQSGVRCLFGKDNDRDKKALDKVNRHRSYRGWHTIKAHKNRFYHRISYAEKYAHTNGDRRKWNWYLSVNSFATWKRSIKTLIGLNGIYDDIDCEKNGVSCADFYIHHREVLKRAKLPYPNLVISSGHGFYFIWIFTRQRICQSRRFLNLWRHLASTVSLKLNLACKSIFGKEPVDTKASQDPSRVLRLPATTNWKNPDQLVKCHLQNFQTDTLFMNNWIAKILPKHHSNKKRHYKHGKRHGRRVLELHPHNFSPFSLLWGRRHDIMNWAYFARKGVREVLLFKLACTDSHIRAIGKIEQDIKLTNARFHDSLPKSEIHDLIVEMHHIDFRKYKIEKTADIISDLEISPSFQKHDRVLKLAQYKHMSRKNAHRRHLAEKTKKYLWIDYLLVTGHTFRQIHSKYGYSLGLISNVNHLRTPEFDRKGMIWGENTCHNA